MLNEYGDVSKNVTESDIESIMQVVSAKLNLQNFVDEFHRLAWYNDFIAESDTSKMENNRNGIDE